MRPESQINQFQEFLRAHAGLIDSLHARADAARWGLARARFAEALCRSARHRFRGAAPSAADEAQYLQSLHVEDLALACACSEGHEPAWEYFLTHYREELYAAARAIVGSRASADEARAHELADSIYAELYGVGRTEGETRRPLFDYFHGRSKLSTWLRAVLAQRHVDDLRAGQRTISLEEETRTAPIRAEETRETPLPDPDRGRYMALFQAALEEALAALAARDRLRLALYYVQELTLAEIGRVLGEHEATASRHLERTRRELRKRVEQTLAASQAARDGRPAQAGLSEAQLRQCFEYALEDWPFDLAGALSQPEDRQRSEMKGKPK